MSDLSAANCGAMNDGCGCDNGCGCNNGNNNCLFLILILLFCGGNGTSLANTFGNGNGCGCNNNSCSTLIWIILLLSCCGGCNGFGF